MNTLRLHSISDKYQPPSCDQCQVAYSSLKRCVFSSIHLTVFRNQVGQKLTPCRAYENGAKPGSWRAVPESLLFKPTVSAECSLSGEFEGRRNHASIIQLTMRPTIQSFSSPGVEEYHNTRSCSGRESEAESQNVKFAARTAECLSEVIG